MNSTFKVVFNKARGALMVVNEVTSSVQAKGTKTVVATAVAAMIAGVAGVAGAADAVFGTEGVLTISTNAEGPTVEATNVKNGTTSDAVAYTKAHLANDMVVAFNADGKSILNLEATKDYAVDRTVANITKSGTINMTSNTEGNKAATLKVGTAEATAVSIAGHNQKLTFNFANSGAGTNKPESVLSTANASATLTLGTSDATGHDFDGAVALNVAKDAYAKVMGGSTGNAALTLENVILTNAGQITFKGSAISVKSAYDGTAEGNTGKVIFEADTTTLENAIADGVVLVGADSNLSAEEKKSVDTQFTGALGVTGEKAALKADTLYVTNSLTLGTEYSSTGPVPSQAGSAEAATVAYVGDGSAGSVVVGSHSTFDAAKLVLNKGSIVVKAHIANDGEHEKAHAGVLSGEELTVVAGSSGNTISNAGKVAFEKVTVAGTNETSAKAATLSITNTSGGTASLGEVTLSGVNATVGTGTLTLTGVLDAVDPSAPKYDFDAASVDIQKGGVLSLAAGAAHVAGDMTVAADGSFTDAAGTILVVDKAFTVNANVEISGSATVGSVSIAKEKTLEATANGLTISGTGDSVNAGTLDAAAKVVAINGGKFTNEKTTGVVKAGDLILSKTEFDNNGTVTIVALAPTTGLLILNKGSSFSTEVAKLTAAGIEVGEDSVLNIKALNLKSSTEAADYDVLNLTHAIELAQGGSITLKGGSLQDVDVRAASLTVGDKSSFESKSLTVGNALSVDGGAVAVTTLEQGDGATVAVNSGVLKADKFWQAGAAPALSVGLDGELQLTAEGIGLVIAADNSFTNFTVQTGSKQFKGVTADKNNGMIAVTGLDGKTITADGLTTLAVKLGTSANSNGILDLGGLTVKNLAATDGKIEYNKIKDLNGVALDYLKAVTVTKVNGQLQGVYGAAQMSGAGMDLSVTKTLVLTGNGDIVTAPTSATDSTLKVANVVLGVAGTTGTVNSAFFYAGQADGNATVGNISEASVGTGGTNKSDVYVKSGNLKAGNVSVDNVIVDGTLTTKNLTVATAEVDGTLTVNGNASVTDLDVAGDMTVDKYVYEATGEEVYGSLTTGATKAYVGGTLTALGDVTFGNGAEIEGTAILGKVKVTAGSIKVGSSDPEESYNGTLFVNELTSGTIYADPAWNEDGVVALGDESRVYVNTVGAATGAAATVHGGQASVVALGTTEADEVDAALAQAGFTQFQKKDGYAAVLYINGDAKVNATGKVLVNGIATDTMTAVIEATAADATAGTKDTLTVINGASFGEEAVTAGAVKLNDVFVANAAVGQAIKLTSGELHIEGDVKVSSGRILEAVDVANEDGTIGIDIKSDDDLGALALVSTIDTLKSYYVNGQNLNETKSKSALFNEFMMQEDNGTKGQIETAAIIEDVAAIGATAGMASVTMDALSAFNDTVAQRTSILAPNAEGVTVWADVNGGRYEAKKLMDGAGYASDIYAGVLGVDTTVACGAKIGAAITVGTGDTDSKNTVAETSMDSDFFGVSIYTAKQFGAANVAVDLGYMQGSNDVDVKAFNLGKFSADSDAFTIGVRGELLTKAGDFNIVPHAGLRWTRISVDSFEAGYDTDIDSMNVFQLPVGVTVSGEFEGAGFTWAPAFDLSFVPAFGDKDADMTLGIRGSNAQTSKLGVQVIDSNPVQATLGIDATNGAWAFGLNYKLGVGTDSRMNNSFNANVRYTF